MNMREIQAKQYIAEDFLVLEGIKTLRSNLMFSGMDKRIFGITSCNASEGKSTTSFQLAASFAQLGKRVLLLDDIVTTGATASECARVLLTAGAGEILFGAVAASGTTLSKKVQ